MRPQQRKPLPSAKTGNTVLESFVEQVCTLTQAEGAAIALALGPRLICRASTGNAPPLGSEVGPESRFTQECVQTAQLVHCRDLAKDTRFQPAPAGAISFRSAMAVPVVGEGDVIGVMEVFSSKPFAFHEEHAGLLQRHAALVALLVEEAGIPLRGPGKVLMFPSSKSMNQRERWLNRVTGQHAWALAAAIPVCLALLGVVMAVRQGGSARPSSSEPPRSIFQTTKTDSSVHSHPSKTDLDGPPQSLSGPPAKPAVSPITGTLRGALPVLPSQLKAAPQAETAAPAAKAPPTASRVRATRSRASAVQR